MAGLIAAPANRGVAASSHPHTVDGTTATSQPATAPPTATPPTPPPVPNPQLMHPPANGNNLTSPKVGSGKKKLPSARTFRCRKGVNELYTNLNIKISMPVSPIAATRPAVGGGGSSRLTVTAPTPASASIPIPKNRHHPHPSLGNVGSNSSNGGSLARASLTPRGTPGSRGTGSLLSSSPPAPSSVSSRRLGNSMRGATTDPAAEGLLAASHFGAVEVLPGLFLGSYADAMNFEGLDQRNISLVINVAVECPVTPAMQQFSSTSGGIRYIHFPLKDHSDEAISAKFLAITSLIHDQLHRRDYAQRMREAKTRASQKGGYATPSPPRHVTETAVQSPQLGGPRPGENAFADYFPENSKDGNSVEQPMSSYSTSVDGEAAPTSTRAPRRGGSATTRSELPRVRTSSNLRSAPAPVLRPNYSAQTTPETSPVDLSSRWGAEGFGRMGNGRLLASPPPTLATSQGSRRLSAGGLSPLTIDAPTWGHGLSARTTSAEEIGEAGGRSQLLPSYLQEGDCGGVLIHCRMGVSRSATFVLAYLILYGTELAPFKELQDLLQQKQPTAEAATDPPTPSASSSPASPKLPPWVERSWRSWETHIAEAANGRARWGPRAESMTITPPQASTTAKEEVLCLESIDSPPTAPSPSFPTAPETPQTTSSAMRPFPRSHPEGAATEDSSTTIGQLTSAYSSSLPYRVHRRFGAAPPPVTGVRSPTGFSTTARRVASSPHIFSLTAEPSMTEGLDEEMADSIRATMNAMKAHHQQTRNDFERSGSSMPDEADDAAPTHVVLPTLQSADSVNQLRTISSDSNLLELIASPIAPISQVPLPSVLGGGPHFFESAGSPSLHSPAAVAAHLCPECFRCRPPRPRPVRLPAATAAYGSVASLHAAPPSTADPLRRSPPLPLRLGITPPPTPSANIVVSGSSGNISAHSATLASPASAILAEAVEAVMPAMGYYEAFEYLKRRKSDVNPNLGFALALRELADGMDASIINQSTSSFGNSANYF